MKQTTLIAFILTLSIIGYSQKVKQDTLTGNYYSATQPRLLKMTVDERGLISYVFKASNGEERAMDYETFDQFNKFFGFVYSGKSYITGSEKFPVYITASGKLFILRTSEKTGLIYKSYLKL